MESNGFTRGSVTDFRQVVTLLRRGSRAARSRSFGVRETSAVGRAAGLWRGRGTVISSEALGKTAIHGLAGDLGGRWESSVAFSAAASSGGWLKDCLTGRS